MNKFNDFSRYKNNELRSYFVKKELELYLKERDKKKNLSKNPINANIFSAIMTATVWTAKTNTNDILIKKFFEDNNLSHWFYYPISVFIAFLLYLIFYFLYFYIVNPLISKFEIFISTHIKSKGTLDIENFKSVEETTNKFYIDKFKYEVINQISLALSIITYVNDDSNNFEISKNKFYINECFHYLNNSLKVLQNEILTSKFVEKVLEPKFYDINTNRINELIELSEYIIKNIDDFWKSNSQYSHTNEISNVNSLIKNIKEIIKEK